MFCFHCEGLENADKFSCLGLSYTKTSCRLLNLHFYQPEVGRRFQNHLQSFLLNASALSTLLCTARSHAVVWYCCRVSYTFYIFQQPCEAKEEIKVTLYKSSWIHESTQKKHKEKKRVSPRNNCRSHNKIGHKSNSGAPQGAQAKTGVTRERRNSTSGTWTDIFWSIKLNLTGLPCEQTFSSWMAFNIYEVVGAACQSRLGTFRSNDPTAT